MVHNKEKTVEDCLMPLNMNGLQGRMLRMPASGKTNREILLVYGHHARLERWWGLVQNLSVYGSVTMPDMPGFGGMDSFYKIRTTPTVDSLADYLASFIQLRFKRRRITIVGISFGFVVVTRMLQRYPELAKKVDLLVSIVGFTRYDEFQFSPWRRRAYIAAARFTSTRVVAPLFRLTCLNSRVLQLAYQRTHNAKHKFQSAKQAGIDMDALMSEEIILWQANDVRTHMRTTAEFLALDNCRQHIDLPVWHVYSAQDHYFYNDIIEQHLNIVFQSVHVVEAKLDSHIVSVVADRHESAGLLPRLLRVALKRAP